ncbi:hypothetical protein CONLIGDRAFT_578335 [Coniochaeta ligniaria NRRL 30616]|uniref:C2H2-type domain-containing protein n=1 Tax=Coniochaeta ligniaria NRRL 30616 TaxID=1408157 RepID=A0A1J7JMU6_9PEZI|nr:hypothetical protein CONLIGDRAFT_578335 [Coniochaeta ligniaria NRRL 30616]
MPSTSSEVFSEAVVRPAKTPRRFECPRCQRQFSRLEHLQRHDRTHTQERPFCCQQCESRFTRSDLLIRHERLSHNKERREAQPQLSTPRLSDTGPFRRSERAAKRMRVSSANGQDPEHQEAASSPVPAQPAPVPHYGSATSPSAAFQPQPSVEGHTLAVVALTGQEYQTPLEALSLAAERSAFHDLVPTPPTPAHTAANGAPPQPPLDSLAHPQAMSSTVNPSMGVMDSGMPPHLGYLDVSFDSFAAFLEAEPMSTHQFASFMPAEQPMSFFPFNAFVNPGEGVYNPGASRLPGLAQAQNAVEEQTSFSRFGSRLPSLHPDEHDASESQHQDTEPSTRPVQTRRVWHVSSEDRQFIVREIAKFDTVLLQQFQLPTRMSLARYIRAYVDGFQEHLPFLHVQSMTVEDSSVELLLAMAAVGAQYCFEAEKGVELFHAARAIATERIRRRDARVALQQRDVEPDYSTQSAISAVSSPAIRDRRESNLGHTVNGPLGLPSDPGSGGAMTSFPPKEDLMQSAQALLILMAMATWAKHKAILREALAIQSVLASIVRDDGLRMGTRQEAPATWEDWIRHESVMRTKYIVFCFFNLHSIVYDIPPLLLNWEIHMPLPCSTAEFKAESEARWREARARADPPSQFQDALRWLFSSDSETPPACHSPLGNYVLIHAIIQHIFLVRQTIRCRVDGDELTDADVAPLEQALRRWQMGWNRSPESSIEPSDPNGPVAFNSTALLRLAYIRLNMDTGPGRALGTRDPLQIAHALREMPAIKRTPKLVRALLHSAHALSIPIKIGVRLVSRTQAFIWSIQHSLCSLECALLLSKWLETVSKSSEEEPLQHHIEPPISEDERKILSLVMTMLDETEFAVPATGKSLESPETARHLSAGVLRVWATIFRGAQTWAIVDVIGSSLNIYADMLEAS